MKAKNGSNVDKTEKSPERSETEQKLITLTEEQTKQIDKLNFENLALWKLAEEKGYEHQAKKKIQEELKNLDEYIASRSTCNLHGCSERVEYRAGLILRSKQDGAGLVIDPYLSVCRSCVKKINMSLIQKRGDWQAITRGFKENKPSIIFSTVYFVDKFGKKVDREDIT